MGRYGLRRLLHRRAMAAARGRLPPAERRAGAPRSAIAVRALPPPDRAAQGAAGADAGRLSADRGQRRPAALRARVLGRSHPGRAQSRRRADRRELFGRHPGGPPVALHRGARRRGRARPHRPASTRGRGGRTRARGRAAGVVRNRAARWVVLPKLPARSRHPRWGGARMINDLWYKNAIIYCLSVGTYMDANGDGVGDFQGLSRRLDYLHGLGVTAIWLMPFQASPGKDDGYDVSDYYAVNPRYGTLGDFVEFTHGAKQRGIRVIIDLVVNHTSDQHPWFQEARRDPNSKYRDWYVWSHKQPTNANKGMVFPGIQKSTWSYEKEARAWYFHRFYDFQPDLNTSNLHVQAEILKIMGFWIQLGVSGFRMDAVPFVISTKGPRIKKP